MRQNTLFILTLKLNYMNRIFIFALLFWLSSCAKDDFLAENLFIRNQSLNFIQQESTVLTPELDALKSQFSSDLTALINLQIDALESAKAAGRIAISENLSESDIATIFSMLATERFINQQEMNQLAASANAHLQALSSYLSPSKLETIVSYHALAAIGFTLSDGASLLPCYDDYEANTLGLTIGYAGCLIFSGGIPGGAVCTMLFAAGVIVVEEQFQNCLQNTYPNGNSGN